MSNNLKVGVGLVAGGIFGVLGIMQLATLGGPPFHYDAATPEARKSFLAERAEGIESTLRRALVSPSGVGPSMRLSATEVDTEAREIRYVIHVNGHLASGANVEAAEMALYKMICPSIVGGELGRANVSVVPSFVRKTRKSSSVLLELPISTSSCNRYL